MKIIKLFVFAAAGMAALCAASCSKGSDSCKASKATCAARATMEKVYEAQMDYAKKNGKYCVDFKELKPFINGMPELEDFASEPAKLTLLPKDKSFELTVKIYEDHMRVKIAPEPISPQGTREPYCLMRKYGEKKVETCPFII